MACGTVMSIPKTMKIILRHYPMGSISGSINSTARQLNHFHFSGGIYTWQLKGAGLSPRASMCRLRALTEIPILTHSSRAGPGTLHFNVSWEKQMLLIHRACFAKQSPQCPGCTIVKSELGLRPEIELHIRDSWGGAGCPFAFPGAEVFAQHEPLE